MSTTFPRLLSLTSLGLKTSGAPALDTWVVEAVWEMEPRNSVLSLLLVTTSCQSPLVVTIFDGVLERGKSLLKHHVYPSSISQRVRPQN
jgi:hypothetical protein